MDLLTWNQAVNISIGPLRNKLNGGCTPSLSSVPRRTGPRKAPAFGTLSDRPDQSGLKQHQLSLTLNC